MQQRTTMNPAWVEKARRALLTGQPRLAELYMRRGLTESPESRSRLASYEIRQALGRLATELETVVRQTAADLFPAAPAPAIRYEPQPNYLTIGSPSPYRDDYYRFRAEELLRRNVREPLRAIQVGGVL